MRVYPIHKHMGGIVIIMALQNRFKLVSIIFMHKLVYYSHISIETPFSENRPYVHMYMRGIMRAVSAAAV